MKRKILIVGVNWLGDSIMSMPAIEAFARENPEDNITVAVKPKLLELWNLFPVISNTIKIESGADGTLKTSRAIKGHGFDRAYIFPNSFRSALLPFMASVPRRIGMAGHTRKAMLTEVTVPESEKQGRMHQAWEYVDILGIRPEGFPRTPALEVSPESLDKVAGMLQPGGINVALIPGAAFGDAKRWPAENFCAVGKRIAMEHGAHVVVMGTSSETEICEEIAQRVGSGAVSAAGKTGISEMVSLLKNCQYALSNDCGGMHVAAAMGVKVVAIFGATDPSKTGPLGEGHRIVSAGGGGQSRDLSPDSVEARRRLASIEPERVYSEFKQLFAQSQSEA